MRRWPLPLLLLLAPALAARAELPNSAEVCRAADPAQDAYAYLRSLSLDLRGAPPTAADLARVEAAGEVPAALIDELLRSEEYVTRMVRRHRALLWSNVENTNLINFRARLARSGSGLHWRSVPALLYRGDRVPCRDVPATFGPGGEIQFVTDAAGNRLEGYLQVAPYWDPRNPIKVCAFDAQAALRSPTGTDCGTLDAYNDARCGCGPDLSFCRVGSDAPVTRALAGDLERRIARVLRDDLPYTELFTSRRAFVNGPLVHFYRHQTGLPNDVTMTPLALEPARLPDLAFTEGERWEEIELPAGHAGVLTSPAFLLRFQTNRARGARFFDAFLCAPLSPPPTPLPGASGALPDPDLQQRDGCKYCHAQLEPTGAFWGRWTERGAGYLPREHFPPRREDCALCAINGSFCSRECRLYYVTRAFTPAEADYLGALSGYLFRKEEHTHHVEEGPALLVAETIIDERFPRCVARRALEGFFGRGLRVEEEPALETLAQDFVRSGYNYRALIKAVVTHPVYRRVR